MRLSIHLCLALIFGLFLLAGCQSTLPETQTESQAKIIFDTDFGGDADDLGALAMLHKYADEGQIELISVMSWSNEKYAIPAMAVTNAYYGRPDLPLGVRDTQEWRTEWNYSESIAKRFADDPEDRSMAEDAVALYRQQLMAAEDQSVTIVTVGPLANIVNLLESPPDAISPLTGDELFHRAVKEMVIMGGRFPTDDTEPNPEWNFDGNMPGVTKMVLETVRTPILFSGYEIGEALKVGHELNNHPKDTPLYVGYKYFSEHAFWMKDQYEGEILDNSSFDQTAVVHAARGDGNGFWTLSEAGRATATEEGFTRWTPDPDGKHRYMILTEKTDAAKAYIHAGMTYIPVSE